MVTSQLDFQGAAFPHNASPSLLQEHCTALHFVLPPRTVPLSLSPPLQSPPLCMPELNQEAIAMALLFFLIVICPHIAFANEILKPSDGALLITSNPGSASSSSLSPAKFRPVSSSPSPGKRSPNKGGMSSRPAEKSDASSSIISSDSVLVALLDSPYTELAEMADEASLLQMLEKMVATHSITILAPRNSFLDNNIDSDFRRFLLEPGNIESLRQLLRFHVIPHRIAASHWTNGSVVTLAAESLEFSYVGGIMKVDLSNVVAPDAIVRRDGIVHGIDRLLIPKSVQNDYNRWKEGSSAARMLAVLPEESPTPESYRAMKAAAAAKAAALAKAAYTPLKPIWEALAPGPAMAPAPAPGPSSGHRWFDGESAVADFISTLVRYGGYNEMADLLVNLTSLAPELAKLVSEGYRVTILAPNDEAMLKLTAEDLAAPGAPEQIIFYHIVSEYQTEESFYNSVRRFGKVSYQTLRDPYKLVAQEEDGTVVFGEGKDKAHLIDVDIFKDGRISVQGIDKVLFPVDETSSSSKKGRKLGEQDEADGVKEHSASRKMVHSGLLCRALGRIMGACH
ncbi:hypothetical protein KP509_29G023000 [Ceratopteris richardii]|uniref:FAS1 domain-containing protein n=1 Tax=Ceratopteris richardii TaxID=49495 RepID=A0A8T2R7N6_CERRI|nr:hypothetical protein KP509_29G023000 [Ceratopteris richardii]